MNAIGHATQTAARGTHNPPPDASSCTQETHTDYKPWISSSSWLMWKSCGPGRASAALASEGAGPRCSAVTGIGAIQDSNCPAWLM